jgi:hypothetical protein
VGASGTIGARVGDSVAASGHTVSGGAPKSSFSTAMEKWVRSEEPEANSASHSTYKDCDSDESLFKENREYAAIVLIDDSPGVYNRNLVRVPAVEI